jgi:hypothetical protein
MKLRFLIGVIVLPILLAGCTISINSQKPVVIRDTVYVEKYWGQDIKLVPECTYPVYILSEKDSLCFKAKDYERKWSK